MSIMAKKKPTPETPPPNPWPQRLKELRAFYRTANRDMSQEEAASKIDCPIGTWRGWEQGRRTPNPMIVKLLKLAFPEFFRSKS